MQTDERRHFAIFISLVASTMTIALLLADQLPL